MSSDNPLLRLEVRSGDNPVPHIEKVLLTRYPTRVDYHYRRISRGQVEVTLGPRKKTARQTLQLLFLLLLVGQFLVYLILNQVTFLKKLEQNKQQNRLRNAQYQQAEELKARKMAAFLARVMALPVRVSYLMITPELYRVKLEGTELEQVPKQLGLKKVSRQEASGDSLQLEHTW